jgi:hypothetical protein
MTFGSAADARPATVGGHRAGIDQDVRDETHHSCGSRPPVRPPLATCPSTFSSPPPLWPWCRLIHQASTPLHPPMMRASPSRRSQISSPRETPCSKIPNGTAPRFRASQFLCRLRTTKTLLRYAAYGGLTERETPFRSTAAAGCLPAQWSGSPPLSVTVRPDDPTAVRIASMFLRTTFTKTPDRFFADGATANGRLEDNLFDPPPEEFVKELCASGFEAAGILSE